MMGRYSCGGVYIPPLAAMVVDGRCGIWWRGGEYMMLGGDWHVLEGYR
jgi:hypothetical protein